MNIIAFHCSALADLRLSVQNWYVDNAELLVAKDSRFIALSVFEALQH